MERLNNLEHLLCRQAPSEVWVKYARVKDSYEMSIEAVAEAGPKSPKFSLPFKAHPDNITLEVAMIIFDTPIACDVNITGVLSVQFFK